MVRETVVKFRGKGDANKHSLYCIYKLCIVPPAPPFKRYFKNRQ